MGGTRAAIALLALLASCVDERAAPLDDGGESIAGSSDAAETEDASPADPREASAHLSEAHCGPDAAFPPGTFVFVGGGGTEGRVGASLDGLEWWDETTRARGASHPGHTRNLVRGAGYGGGVFVLVGGSDNAYVVTSCDGVHFRHDVLGTNAEAPPPPAYDDFLSDVAYGEGVFVAAGGAGKRLSSFDHGRSWEETGEFVAGHFRSVEAGGGRFVAVGATFDLTRAISATSEDGREWSEVLVAGEPLDRGLAYGAGVFVAIGEERCAVSEDGRRWDPCALEEPEPHFLRVQFVGGRFFLQLEGRTLESDDGRSFRDAGSLALPPNLIEGPGLFVFASASERGASGSLDAFETRPLEGFRALSGGEVLYAP